MLRPRAGRRVPAAAGVLTLALLLATGCASTGGTADRPREERNVLTREEIASVDVSNLYDVVQRLRPGWLRTKGAGERSSGVYSETRILVARRSTVLGGPGVLREISPDGVTGLRYHPGNTAGVSPVGSRTGRIEGVISIERDRND